MYLKCNTEFYGSLTSKKLHFALGEVEQLKHVTSKLIEINNFYTLLVIFHTKKKLFAPL